MGIRYLMVVAVAAASIAAATVANSAATLTPKQALLQGATVAGKASVEPRIGRLIVKLREGAYGASPASAARLRELEAATGIGMTHVRDLAGGAALMALHAPMPLSQARTVAARLAADPAVEYAEPDVMMKKVAVPNEVRFAEWQWTLFSPTALYTGPLLSNSRVTKSAPATGGANLPLAWDLSGGGSSAVVVAVIDTGIVNHPDLNGIATPAPYAPAGRFVAGYDFVSSDVGTGDGLPMNFVENDVQPGRDADPTDPGDWVTTEDEARYPAVCDDGLPGPQESSWHGTHMSGIAAATANNNVGIAGVGWNVRLQPIRALGKCGGALTDIAAAIRWAAGLEVPGAPMNQTPARVVSLSLGSSDSCPQYMQEAVDAAIAAGSVVVAATGNESDTSLISPANCMGVISVTAHTISGENADYSNIAPSTVISAPGGGGPSLPDPSGVTDDPNWSGYYVWSTLLFGPTDPWSIDSDNRTGAAYGGFTGTSAAAPHVAGVAALIKSVLPGATPLQVRTYIAANARPFPAGSACASGGAFVGQCGAGLLDAAAAVGAAARIAPPIIASAPQSVTILDGQSATFSVTAAGAATLSYQWLRNGIDIAGATGPTYTTGPLTIADTGTRFSVRVSNSLGTITSTEAIVTVVTATNGGSSVAPSGGGGGAVPPGQWLLLAALLLAARIRRRE